MSNLTSWGTAILPRQLIVSITLMARPAFLWNHVFTVRRTLTLISPKAGPMRRPILTTRWRVVEAKAEITRPIMRITLPKIATNRSLLSSARGPTRRVAMLQVVRNTEKILA